MIINLLMGLPGSGKTSYAKTFNSKDTKIIDADKLAGFSLSDLASIILEQIWSLKKNTIIIDGLFLSNKSIDNLFQKIFEKCECEIEFQITYWKENRELCLVNDKSRSYRNKNSEITIKNAKFEKLSEELIKKYKIKVIEMEVYQKSDCEKWIDEIKEKSKIYLKDDFTLQSNDWSLGGKWGNCWGDSGNIEAETPVEFKEFDDLMFAIDKDMPFLIYRKIRNNCVSIKTRSYDDYYGGYSKYCYYSCDMKYLYDFLKENKII